MGLKNRIERGGLYYITMTVVDWVDIFTRPIYRHILVDSLKFCQEKKNLDIYAWCLMSNHLHMIAAGSEGKLLSDILRDFKQFTSKKITSAIEEGPESRSEWMLYRFKWAGRFDPKITNYKFWQEGNEPKEIVTEQFMLQKLEYIHQNPVRAEIVAEPEHYLYSSASNYAGMGGVLNVILLT